MLAKDIMTKQVITVNKVSLVKEIAKIFIEEKISGAPVVDSEGNLVGIITRKDLIYKDIEPKFPSYIEFLGGLFYVEGIKQYEEKLKKFLANKAEDMMTKDVITISEDTHISQISEIMIEKRVNLLPVISDGEIVGIVTRSDILKTLL